MLPELNGLEVLRRLRKSSNVPVIMLTARDAVMDKVSGLDLGANDYITKPFAIEECLQEYVCCFATAHSKRRSFLAAEA
jgi:DNA-binding response OmpR family regulator